MKITMELIFYNRLHLLMNYDQEELTQHTISTYDQLMTELEYVRTGQPHDLAEN